MERTPEEIEKGLECCYGNAERRLCEKCPNGVMVEGYSEIVCTDFDSLGEDALAYIKQLEAEKKHLQDKICNQRRQLRLLHAMYEWALGRLQHAKLNDRAHFQRWLMDRGYDLSTLELPEAPKEDT